MPRGMGTDLTGARTERLLARRETFSSEPWSEVLKAPKNQLRALSLRTLAAGIVFLAIAGTARASTLTIAWDPSSDPSVAGYVLYWGAQSGVYTNSLNVGLQTSQPIGGLVNNITYYFTVRAYNSAGALSDPSTEVSGHTNAAGRWAPTWGDFQGTGKADFSVFRRSTGYWYSSSGVAERWGNGNDRPVPGD